MVIRKVLNSLFIALLLFGCASSSRRVIENYLNLVKTGKYDQAIKVAQEKKLYSSPKDKLLRMLEIGMLYHLKGDYKKSIEGFKGALDVSDKLYTKSISKKALSFVSSDNSDNYYGERYERSMLRFYLALNNILLAQDSQTPKKEKINALSRARAYILEWDSLLQSFRADKSGKSVYKDDMVAKMFGAWIHELSGSSSDIQVARQLYIDSTKLLFQNYNSYPSFNSSYQSFRKDFDKLHEMKKSAVEKKYVAKTAFYDLLSSYAETNRKNVRKNEGQLVVLLQKGFIKAKEAKKFDFPLNLVSLPAGVMMPLSGGKMGFAEFSMRMLNTVAGTKPSIYFELPVVPLAPVKEQYSVQLLNKNGKVVQTKKLTLINPLSDIAWEALDEQIGVIRAKTGARLAVKHITALTSAYVTYKTTHRTGIPALAFISASAMYAGLNKGIASSESADLRQWRTLPHAIFMEKVSLKRGEYTLKLLAPDNKTELYSQTVRIGKGSKLHNIRLY